MWPLLTKVFFDWQNLAKHFFQIFKIQNINEFGGFLPPKVRGKSNKNRQTSIFEFQSISKSREGLLNFCNSYMVYGHFWLHLPRDDHLPTSSYGSSPLWLKFKFTASDPQYFLYSHILWEILNTYMRLEIFTRLCFGEILMGGSWALVSSLSLYAVEIVFNPCLHFKN